MLMPSGSSTRSGPGGPRCAAGLALTVLLVCGASVSHAAPSSLRERVTSDSLMFVRGIATQRLDSVLTQVASDIPLARAAGDRASLASFLRFQGVALAMSGRGPDAVRPLEESLALSLAERDTMQAMLVLRWRTYVAGMLGDYGRQEGLAQQLLTLARAAGSGRYESVALNFSGWIALRRGQHARAITQLERAVALQRRLGLEDDEAVALTALGSALRATGEWSRARAAYVRQLEIARRRALAWSEAQALNELGILELDAGDPALAASYFERARAVHCAAGATYDCAAALFSLVNSELAMGREESALALARRGVALADSGHFTRLRGAFRVQLARAEFQRGRVKAAARMWESIEALGDSLDADSRAHAAIGLASVHRREVRPREAVALLRGAIARLAPRLPRPARLELESALLASELAAGEFRSVLGRASRLESEARVEGDMSRARFALQMRVAALSKLGLGAEALAACDRLMDLLEHERSRTHDLEWREQIGEWGSEAPVLCSAIQAAPSVAEAAPGAARAYETLLRFRTRTLLERMSRRAADSLQTIQLPVPARPGQRLADLQRRVLRPGELLLEWGVTAERTLLFAITSDATRVVEAPGGRALADSIALALDVLASGPVGDAILTRSVGEALGALLFRGCEDLVRGAEALALAPDGPLHRVPFAALVVAGRLLGESHRLSTVPSGAVLARLRASQAAPLARGLLAFDSGPEVGGPSLRGASREVEWLTRRFEGVVAGSAASAGTSVLPEDLSRFDALHFAGHTELDNRFPWRSGIVLLQDRDVADTAAAGVGRDGFLTAEHIARLPLSARLVVLASCESARGRERRGEGLAGLSSAFLAAGAHSVVATLWRVDDAVTERLVQELYRHLGAGETVAGALRMAQTHVRSQTATSHPYYWAGFVVIGDGTTQLPLTARPTDWRPHAGMGLVLLLAIAAVAASGNRLRGRRRDS